MKKVKVLLYCTKAKPYLYKNLFIIGDDPTYVNDYKEIVSILPLNGRVVAECEVETEEIRLWGDEIENYFGNNAGIDIEERACLKFEQIEQYLCTNNYKGYALHISNLKIFKQPKKLNDYSYRKKYGFDTTINMSKVIYLLATLYFAPQNMMKVYDHNCNPLVLISINSVELCKILNGDKTIDIRKKVLKEML